MGAVARRRGASLRLRKLCTKGTPGFARKKSALHPGLFSSVRSADWVTGNSISLGPSGQCEAPDNYGSSSFVSFLTPSQSAESLCHGNRENVGLYQCSVRVIHKSTLNLNCVCSGLGYLEEIRKVKMIINPALWAETVGEIGLVPFCRAIRFPVNILLKISFRHEVAFWTLHNELKIMRWVRKTMRLIVIVGPLPALVVIANFLPFNSLIGGILQGHDEWDCLSEFDSVSVWRPQFDCHGCSRNCWGIRLGHD